VTRTGRTARRPGSTFRYLEVNGWSFRYAPLPQITTAGGFCQVLPAGPAGQANISRGYETAFRANGRWDHPRFSGARMWMAPSAPSARKLSDQSLVAKALTQ